MATPIPYQVKEYERVDTTLVAAAATIVIEKDTVGEVGHLCLSVENIGANPITAAVLQISATRKGTYHTYISDWTTISVLMKYISTRLDTLAAGAKTTMYLEIPPCAKWKLVLTSSSGTTVNLGGYAR